MNTTDLINAIQGRLETARDNCQADGTHLYDTAYREGLTDAIEILEGVLYEWGEMQNPPRQDLEENHKHYLTYK